VTIGLVALLLAAPSTAARTAPDAVTAAAQKNFGELFELLSIPDIADVPADIQRNAQFLQRAFEKRGFSARLLDNAAHRPLVFAELPSSPAAKTLLFYLHFDGQPLVAEEWAQKSPFDPVVKKRASDGRWHEVAAAELQKTPIDPELRIFARAASDDKGPISMFLTAMDVLAASKTQPALHVKVLLDSEEEISSPSLASVIAANPGLFAADGLVILDGPVHASGKPTLVFGNRGIAQVTLTVHGPPSPLHSGHFGNYAPNPAMRLAQLLASMKDGDGRVLIPGYYDGVRITPEDRAVLARTGDDEAALTKRIGVSAPEKAFHGYQEALQYPSLNVRGMAAGAVGSKAANVVPSEAVAEIDMRTTPETDGHRLFELLRTFVQRQGYHLVEGAPTPADRGRYEKLASLKLGAVQAAERMPMDSPLGRWAAAALSRLGTQPVRIRMMGGTVPTDVLVAALKLPFVLVPTVNPDNNQHAHDENLRVGNFIEGTRTIEALLTTPWR
jgi:acetylornithine deacetylase/succinyl-diaminopimelate desuccinylase-like protein